MYKNILKFARQIYKDSRIKLKKVIKKNWKKLSAFSMAVKVFTMFSMIALVPIGLADVSHKPYNTKIKLDRTNPFVLSTDQTVQVGTGVSNLDAQKMAKTTGQIAYAKTYANVERDGSYFQNVYKAAAAKYGIPWQLLQAVHYVETGCSDDTTKGSSAGARGPMQFMPGTWRAYADDGDNDGNCDIYDADDAIFGAAKLLANGGADAGDIDGALFNYNHSMSYVYKVKEVMASVQ